MKQLFFLTLSLLAAAKGRASGFEWKSYMTVSAIEADQKLLTNDGVGKDLDYSRFAKFGISASTEIDEHWDAIINLVFRGGTSKTQLDPVDYALLSYRADDSRSQVRIGRSRTSTWLISDYLNVGILYPWVRPPVEVYDLNPLAAFNMVSYKYTVPLVDGSFSVEVYGGGGATQVEVDPTTVLVTSRDAKVSGLNLNYVHEKLQWRASYLHANISFNAYRDTVVPGALLGLPFDPAFAAKIPLDFGEADFYSTGVKGDIDRLSIWTEYAYMRADAVVNKRASGYVTVGYKFFDGKLMPHVTYSKYLESEFKDDGAYAGTFGKQNTTTVGVNYFISANTMFKFDASNVNFTDGGYVLVTDPASAVTRPGVNGAPNSMWIYAASINASF